jgi:hypothetical protein
MTEAEWLERRYERWHDEGVTFTEEEWLRRDHPVSVVETMPRVPDERRLRLFACACSRRIWSLLVNEELRRVVEFAEALADGRLSPPDHEAARALIEPWSRPTCDYGSAVSWALSGDDDFALIAAECARDAVASASTGGRRRFPSPGYKASIKSEQREQVSFARDIFGNPFRLVTFDPAWLTSTAVAIASGMYESRDFTPMPILADALQDAGCDSDDILNHCRGPGPHVRGCWVVDLVLG